MFTPICEIFFKPLDNCIIVCVLHLVWMYVHTCHLDMSQCQHACILEQVYTMLHMILYARIFVAPCMYSDVIIICTYIVFCSLCLYMCSAVRSHACTCVVWCNYRLYIHMYVHIVVCMYVCMYVYIVHNAHICVCIPLYFVSNYV